MGGHELHFQYFHHYIINHLLFFVLKKKSIIDFEDTKIVNLKN